MINVLENVSRLLEFKSSTRLFEFHVALMALEKKWIQLFPL